MKTQDAEDIRVFSERAKNRRNARVFVEKYTWEDIVADFEGILEGVIRGW